MIHFEKRERNYVIRYVTKKKAGLEFQDGGGRHDSDLWTVTFGGVAWQLLFEIHAACLGNVSGERQ